MKQIIALLSIIICIPVVSGNVIPVEKHNYKVPEVVKYSKSFLQRQDNLDLDAWVEINSVLVFNYENSNDLAWIDREGVKRIFTVLSAHLEDSEGVIVTRLTAVDHIGENIRIYFGADKELVLIFYDDSKWVMGFSK